MDRRSFFQHSALTSLATLIGLRTQASPPQAALPTPALPGTLAPALSADTHLPNIGPATIPADRLEFWRRQDRVPVWETDNPDLILVIEAIRSNRRLFFRYPDADHSETRRNLSPSLAFKVKEFPSLYVAGYCHLRGEERVFHFSRMRRLILVTKLAPTNTPAT